MGIFELLAVGTDWIEAHGNTVDLLKWISVGLLAWFLGVFSYIRTKLQRPTVEVESFTSRCIWQNIDAADGVDPHVRVIFLVEAGVLNPTDQPIVVRDFNLLVSRVGKGTIPNQPLGATTLPCRVRHSTKKITKFLNNWFSNFDEGSPELTLSSRIEPKDFSSGFLLFVSVSHGYLEPLRKEGTIPVELHAHLTTGEKLSAESQIVIVDDHDYFESLVPGVLEHVESRETWNLIRPK